MELRITTLIENQQDNKDELKYEHGLSLYIEFDGKRLLFDTGQSGDFISNAEMLGKDLSILDYLLLSHGHYDHTGGVKRLLPILSRATVMCVGKEFFQDKYKRMEGQPDEYLGINFTEQQLIDHGVQLNKVENDITKLTDRILLFKNFNKASEYEKLNTKFVLKQGETYVTDDFKDEIALGLLTSKGLVVVVGCSHVGIVNILKTIQSRVNVPIYAVVGGTHLVEADENRVEKTLEAFEEMNIKELAVSHCTGEAALYMQKRFKGIFIVNNTGNVIEI